MKRSPNWCPKAIPLALLLACWLSTPSLPRSYAGEGAASAKVASWQTARLANPDAEPDEKPGVFTEAEVAGLLKKQGESDNRLIMALDESNRRLEKEKKSLMAMVDDPTPPAIPPTEPPKPVVPVAQAVVPAVQPLVIVADGSTTKTPLSWQVIEPADAMLRVEGPVAMIFNPAPGMTYKLALVAFGDVPPFAFRFVNVTAPGVAPVVVPPVVTPPVVVTPPPVVTPTPAPVVVPTPAPAPASTDRLGMTAFTRALVQPPAMTWDPASLKFRTTTFAAIFDDAAIVSPVPTTRAAMEKAIGTALEAATGKDATWQAKVITPIKGQIQALVAAKKLVTPADLAEAFAEIGAALKETN